MNGLTAGLAAAQESVSPRYELAVRAGPRATAWGRAGGAWQEVAAFPTGLAAWHAQSIATDAVALPGGVLRVFLSWKQGALACQHVAMADLANAAAWGGNSLVSVATFSATVGIDVARPALVAEGGRVHCYYLLPDGNIYHRQSSDDGATWGSASTVYGGGDAVGDISACHFAEADVHLVHFSTSTGGVRLRGASRLAGGAWNVWAAHGDVTGWVAAGVMVTGALSATLLAWVRTAAPYTHHLGALECTVTAAGGLSMRDVAVETAWLVSGDAAIRPNRHAVGGGLGGWLHTCQEQSAGRAYLCVGAVEAAPCHVEEPAPVTAEVLGTTQLERHFAPVEIGAQTLLVGLAAIHTSLHGAGSAEDVEGDGDGVIAYRCTVRADGGGRLELLASPASPLVAAEIGWALWLTRRCTKGSNTGAVTLGFRIMRIERHSDGVRIVALDALGLLKATVARRALQFAPAAFSVQGAVERLAAWAGLGATCSDLSGDAPLMQWSGGEDGLHALHVLLRTQAVGIASRCAAGGRPAVHVAARATTAAAAFGDGGHPLVAHVRVADARSPRLVVVQGLAMRGDPAEGEEWALAAGGPGDPTVRARPIYVLNRNLDAAAQVAEAGALLAAVSHASPAGWMTIQAHLALECGDCISVEGETVHVQGIVEEWERRRLVQRVEYGR